MHTVVELSLGKSHHSPNEMLFWFALVLTLSEALSDPFAVKPGTKPLYFGAMGTVTGSTHRTMSAATLAAWVINNASEILPDYTLVPVLGDDLGKTGNNFFVMLNMATGGHGTPLVNFVIGPMTSAPAAIAAEVATPYRIPIISPQATSSALTGSANPYFSRTIYSDTYQSRALANVVASMGWESVGVLWSSDAYGTSFINAFQEACDNVSVNVALSQSYDVSATEITSQVTQMKRSGLLIFLIFGYSAAMTSFIIPALHAMGMVGAPYVYLFPDGISLTSAAMTNFTQGCLQTTPTWPVTTPEYQTFVNNWKLAASINPLIVMNTTSTTASFASAAPSYDAVFVAAKAFAKLIALNDSCQIDANSDPLCLMVPGDQLNHLIRNTTHFGATGYIVLNENGERLFPSYGILNGRNGSAVQVGWVVNEVTSFIADIIWADGTKNIPLDHIPLPRAGLSSKQRVSFVVVESFILVIIAISEGVVWKYRNSMHLRAYSPVFILVLFFGCALFVAAGMVMSFPPTKQLCGLSVWLLCFAYTCVVGPVGLKLYRLDRIFNSKIIKNVDLPDSALFGVLGVMLLVDMTLLLFYSFYGVTVSMTEGCGTTNWAPLAILVAIKGLWLVSSFVLLGRTRNIPSAFNEPFTVALVLYTVAACSLMFGLFNGFITVQRTSLMMQVASILVGALGITGGVVISKLRSHIAGVHSSHSASASYRGTHSGKSSSDAVAKRLDRRDLDTLVAHGQMMVGTLSERRAKMDAEIVMWTEQVYLAKREIQFLLSSASTTVAASHISSFSQEAIELISAHTSTRKTTKNTSDHQRSKGDSSGGNIGSSPPASPSRQLAGGAGSSQSHPALSLRGKASFSHPAPNTALSVEIAVPITVVSSALDGPRPSDDAGSGNENSAMSQNL